MSHPAIPGENDDQRTTTWPNNASDATQVIRPAAARDEEPSSNADPIESSPGATPAGAAPSGYEPGKDDDRTYSNRDDGPDGRELDGRQNDRQVRVEPRTYASASPAGAPFTARNPDAATPGRRRPPAGRMSSPDPTPRLRFRLPPYTPRPDTRPITPRGARSSRRRLQSFRRSRRPGCYPRC